MKKIRLSKNKLDKFRKFTMFIMRRVFPFGGPSHRFTLIPSMALFKSFFLFFCNFCANFRFSVTFVRTKLSFIISRLKFFVTKHAVSWFQIFIGRWSTNSRLEEFFHCFRMIFKNMFSVAFTQLKVVYIIIGLISIFVMNTLSLLKGSFKKLRHNVSVFKDISLFLGIRVFRFIYSPISISFNSMFHFQYYNTGN